MSNYEYSDYQLNQLNQGWAVYSVNSGYVKRKSQDYKGLKTVVGKPNEQLKPDETNKIKTKDGQYYQVIVTKVDPETGFDGMAVAPIVNGVPDYSSVAVIAAGTDPNNTHHRPLPGFVSADVASAIEARQGYLSPQYPVLDKFIQENPNVFLV
jgi:hypothetical protein